MKRVFLILLCFNTFAFENDIIHNPALSKRCRALIKDRNNKLEVSQKLKSLEKRANNLKSKIKKNQKQLDHSLGISIQKVRRQLNLTNINIAHMEEKIVRSGCPGISL
ncbi:MAG: hypothetical protein N4A33_06165 [Bacteriovoracaceae bacterium]|jgi:uncharacterized protein YlxW (UPF0749 family)|nr:hypothetical protein [Bacteriovoracaceae bacterium]